MSAFFWYQIRVRFRTSCIFRRWFVRKSRQNSLFFHYKKKCGNILQCQKIIENKTASELFLYQFVWDILNNRMVPRFGVKEISNVLFFFLKVQGRSYKLIDENGIQGPQCCHVLHFVISTPRSFTFYVYQSAQRHLEGIIMSLNGFSFLGNKNYRLNKEPTLLPFLSCGQILVSRKKNRTFPILVGWTSKTIKLFPRKFFTNWLFFSMICGVCSQFYFFLRIKVGYFLTSLVLKFCRKKISKIISRPMILPKSIISY